MCGNCFSVGAWNAEPERGFLTWDLLSGFCEVKVEHKSWGLSLSYWNNDSYGLKSFCGQRLVGGLTQ